MIKLWPSTPGDQLTPRASADGRERRNPFDAAPLPSPSTRVERYRPELAEPTRLAHNDAFSTHWGSAPRGVEQWQELVGSRNFQPQVSFVSLAEDGSVLAYVLVRQWVETEAWITLVGTRQQARGRGLARACLTASLRACASTMPR